VVLHDDAQMVVQVVRHAVAALGPPGGHEADGEAAGEDLLLGAGHRGVGAHRDVVHHPMDLQRSCRGQGESATYVIATVAADIYCSVD
jgi:hypothetical protein